MENFPQMEKKTHYLSISGDSTYPRLCRVASREIQSRSQKGLRGNSSLYLHLSENGRETFHNPPQIHLSFFFCSNTLLWLPRWLSGKELICQCRRHGFNPQVGKIPWEGNGNQFQYSCLGNPTDRGGWQATVHGAAKRVRHNQND